MEGGFHTVGPLFVGTKWKVLLCITNLLSMLAMLLSQLTAENQLTLGFLGRAQHQWVT